MYVIPVASTKTFKVTVQLQAGFVSGEFLNNRIKYRFNGALRTSNGAWWKEWQTDSLAKYLAIIIVIISFTATTTNAINKSDTETATLVRHAGRASDTSATSILIGSFVPNFGDRSDAVYFTRWVKRQRESSSQLAEMNARVINNLCCGYLSLS